MHARGWVIGVLVATAATVAAEPAPKPVDIKALKAKAIVLADARGGTYVVFRGGGDDPKLFYGPSAKAVYEQIIIGSSSSGDDFDFSTFAPRLPGVRYGNFAYKDKTYSKSCDGKDDAVLTELTGDKAKAVLDKTAFLTMGTVHVAHLLARDDSGVYYYVDRFAKAYGGKGYRVFVGKKGAMKAMPLSDVASDSAGDVFSTKTGDLRFVHTKEDDKMTLTWVRGEKRTTLIKLDTDVNSPLIFKDLGVYGFMGTLCENI
jgi:hypothetical protein